MPFSAGCPTRPTPSGGKVDGKGTLLTLPLTLKVRIVPGTTGIKGTGDSAGAKSGVPNPPPVAGEPSGMPARYGLAVPGTMRVPVARVQKRMSWSLYPPPVPEVNPGKTPVLPSTAVRSMLYESAGDAGRFGDCES